jgi:phosphatidylglycerophosphate synthase
MGIPFITAHPKSKPEDGAVSRHFNRWLSSPLSRLLIRTNISPNQVSFATALLAIPMVVAGKCGYLLIVASLWQLISILDGIDGEIARAKNLSTQFGALLDTVLDYLIDSLGALAIGLALIHQSAISPWIVLSIVSIAILVRLITNFAVKSVPSRRGLIPESRCSMVLLVLAGAILSEFTSYLAILVMLLLISAIRVTNCVYRMSRFYMAERSHAYANPVSIAPVVCSVVRSPPGFAGEAPEV